MLNACLLRLRSAGLGSMTTCGEHRGALIVLEGLDRSGKSSQSASLLAFLRSRDVAVEAWRFPDRTTSVGRMISSYLSSETELDDHSVHLLFSANRWEKRSLMEKKLMSGTTLIVDRYSYSGVAFSSAKGLDFSWCKAPEVGLLAPDLVLYLNIPPEIAAYRGGYGDERYEHVDFQKKVAEQYLRLCDSTWQNVDATQEMDCVHEVVRDASIKVIHECHQGRDLFYMWPS